jgi:redox-sensitive bicupin YhaK (pirin superfamily)
MIEAIWTGLRFPAGGFQNVVAAPVAPDGKMRAIGPFVAIAHAQPTLLAPGALPLDDDVRPHPHIGIAALSYLFDGAMTHRDSLGATQVIEPGAVNWMVAGRGVVHSERYETLRRDGGRMHGLQIWVALPEAHEGDEPSFHHHSAVEVPEFEGDGVRGRLLAGAADGLVSPVSARWPLYLCDLRLDEGAAVGVPKAQKERALYLISGSLECSGRLVEAGQTIVFASRSDAQAKALRAAHVLSFGGDPIGKRFLWWNFVSSAKDRIEAAKTDWREGRFGLPPDDALDFTPLPADHERPLLELNA